MYASIVGEDRIQATFSAACDNVDKLCKEIKELMTEMDLKGHIFAVELLAREAANNAVLHGCESNPSHIIESFFEVKDGVIALEITDCGSGFDWRETFRKDSETYATSGRGMEIFRTYATEISFNEKGNGLLLKRTIT